MITTPADSHIAYRMIVGSRLPRLMRRLARGGVVFCFHNVLPARHTGRGDASLHMAVEHFESLIEWVAGAYTVVPLYEMVRRVRDGRALRGLAALTFDDAYGGCIHHGLPALDRFGLPATVFVVSRAAEHPKTFWWDQLAERGLMSDQQREEHLHGHRGVEAEVMSSLREPATASSPDLPREVMSEPWEGLRTALRDHELVEIGSHTATHPNLTALTPSELATELRTSRDEISEAVQRDVDTISYPYGLHDPRVLAAAREAGYAAGVTLGPGLVRSGRDPLGIPRLNVPATIGLEALECWALGLHP